MQFTHHVIHQPIRYSVATRFGSTNVVMTHKVADLGLKAIGIAVEAISYFDEFCRLAGQGTSHDVGVIEIENYAVMFEIAHLPAKPPLPTNAERLVRLARVDELDRAARPTAPLHS